MLRAEALSHNSEGNLLSFCRHHDLNHDCCKVRNMSTWTQIGCGLVSMKIISKQPEHSYYSPKNITKFWLHRKFTLFVGSSFCQV
jgi:hypothetical protein